MLKKTDDSAVPKSKGLNTVYNILSLEKEQTPNCMDVNINYDGSVEERLGTNTQNALVIAESSAIGFSQNSTGTLSTSLRSFWRLDEASDSRKDAVGMVTLLDSGNVGSTAGIKNQAAIFYAATGQALYQANASTLSGNGNFSLSSWFYLNSTNPTIEMTVASKRDIGGPFGGIDTSTVLVLHCDGTGNNFIDSCLVPHIMTASGGVTQNNAHPKFGPTAAAFPFAGSYLQTPNIGTDWNFGTGDFTVECQLFVTATNGTPIGLLGTGYQNGWAMYVNDPPQIVMFVTNTAMSANFSSFALNTYYHIAAVRSSSNVKFYINGSSIGSVANAGNITGNTGSLFVGWDAQLDSTFQMDSGYLDEVRVSKTARWATDFIAPTSAYANANNIEYWLYVNTDNILNFSVSSSGMAVDGTIRASSFGALTTATWYNAVGWVDSSNGLLGVSVNLVTNSAAYTKLVYSGSASFALGAASDGAGFFMDGRIDETGYWAKALTTGERNDLYNVGSGNTYQGAFDTQPWASFDFGASALRWLTCCAGTGVYASSNLGVTWVNIATDRTANYQYLDRSKNVLVATSDSYDTPLYWSGSAGSLMAMLNSNATACKFNINYQGFLILLNSRLRKRGFFYQDENTQLTGTWTNNFDIPSSQDDEITACFVLRRYLYISTRYRIYRVNFVGGNPDWQFIEMKNWGFIPRTVKKVILTNETPGVGLYYSVGEIAIGLTWDRKMRVFDGSNDQIISNPIEQDNSQCDFALNKISYQGSGPVISFGETDPNTNVYHLCVAIGADSARTTHFLNYDGRAFAFYPWSNMPYNTMCMAESANQRFLMAFDRSGKCHMMNSGNLDANTTLVSGLYDLPLIFNKTPSQSTKGHRMDLFFSNNTGGNLLYQDRIDSRTTFTTRKTFLISGSDQKIIHYETIDVPETYNMYQARIMRNPNNNSPSFQPWRLLRYDHFNAGLGIGKND